MDKQEFIDKVLFKPWVNRAATFDEMDCFGLVQLYNEHVLGVPPFAVKGYEEGARFGRVVSDNINKYYFQCGRYQEHAMVMFYKGELPIHVGICIGGNRVLHCNGGVDQEGKVEDHPLSALMNPDYMRATKATFWVLND